MFRLLIYMLVAVFLITIVRSMVGIVLRGFSDMLRSQTATKPRPSVPLSGELKKDPVCGTYTSAATSIQQTVHGQTFYFCSAQCRDKYLASLPV
jgi:uncharacterized protein